MAEEAPKSKVVIVLSAILGVVATAAAFKENIEKLFKHEEVAAPPTQTAPPSVTHSDSSAPSTRLHGLISAYLPEDGSNSTPLRFDEFVDIFTSKRYDAYTVAEFLRRLKGNACKA